MLDFVCVVAGVVGFWLGYGWWFRARYVVEEWPVDEGWLRLEEYKRREPERDWTVHRWDREAGTMEIRGLRVKG